MQPDALFVYRAAKEGCRSIRVQPSTIEKLVETYLCQTYYMPERPMVSASPAAGLSLTLFGVELHTEERFCTHCGAPKPVAMTRCSYCAVPYRR
jgi:hypothetical protein